MIRLGKGGVFAPRPLNRVIMLGCGISAYSWVQETYHNPLVMNEPGLEVWAQNQAGLTFRCHALWSMHNLDRRWDENLHGVREYANLTCPVVTTRSIPELPNSQEFALQEVLEHWSDPYFSGTLPYMLAFVALCKKPDAPLVVELYGTDYDYPGVQMYEAGRGCAEYWIGRLRERGIDVRVAQSSLLLDTLHRCAAPPGLYGYDEFQPELRPEGKGLKMVGWQATPEMLEPSDPEATKVIPWASGGSPDLGLMEAAE